MGVEVRGTYSELCECLCGVRDLFEVFVREEDSHLGYFVSPVSGGCDWGWGMSIGLSFFVLSWVGMWLHSFMCLGVL